MNKMKKNKAISLVLCIILVFITGCTSTRVENKHDTNGKENKQIAKEFNNINMIVDPRIELLSVIIYLCPDYNESTKSITPENLSYKKDVEERFNKFKNHKAVKIFRSMFNNNGFSYDAPPTAMLFLSNTPNLTLREDIDKQDYVYTQCMERAGGEKKFLKFVEALNDFCAETNFYEFYNEHLDYYNKIIDNTVNNLEDIDYVSQVEKYYGKEQRGYNIVLNGMLYANNYGPKIKNKDGSYDLYSILGSRGIKNDVPVFSDDVYFKYIVRHEFGHSFVNYLATENIKEVNKYSKLYEPIKADMEKQAYSTWETCLNEHIVRAVVIRITDIYGTKEEADKYLKMEKERGFIYVEDIIDLLKKEYEPNRDKYKTFEDFYPQILKLLDKLMQKNH